VVVDSSRRAENEGFKVHLIRSGANKGVGVGGTRITDENIDVLQTTVNDDHEMFLKAILRGRGHKGLTEDALRSAADGRHYSAAKALELKLIDGVMTLDDAIKQTSSFLANSKRAAGPSENTNTVSGDLTMPSEEKPKAEETGQAPAAVTPPPAQPKAASVSELKAAFPNHPNFVIEQAEKGATLQDAKIAFADVLAAENKALQQQVKDAEQKAAKSHTDGVPPLKVGGEGSGSAAGDFIGLAKARADEKKISISQAMSEIAAEQPDAYKKHLQACNAHKVKDADDDKSD
jgi:hypothetical protein